MYNWLVIHGIKRKPHLSVVWNWYHFVAIAILHQPRPTDSANINTRLQLSDTSSIPPMHGGFLLKPHASACQSVHPYDHACTRNSRNIYQIFFNLGWNIIFGEYLGQLRWWVRQLIKYAHRWPKSDLDIFLIPEIQGWVSSGRNLFLPGHPDKSGRNLFLPVLSG